MVIMRGTPCRNLGPITRVTVVGVEQVAKCFEVHGACELESGRDNGSPGKLRMEKVLMRSPFAAATNFPELTASETTIVARSNG
jgi:hypothetical protein